MTVVTHRPRGPAAAFACGWDPLPTDVGGSLASDAEGRVREVR